MEGIAGYENCMGIPTVGGKLFFDSTYECNPLINVMCLGLVQKDKIVKVKAKGAGNSVFYVGSSTGRDGLGGASFASRELSEHSYEDRPAVKLVIKRNGKTLIDTEVIMLFKIWENGLPRRL